MTVLEMKGEILLLGGSDFAEGRAVFLARRESRFAGGSATVRMGVDREVQHSI